MRYAFHGKVRATGQKIAGYVEAGTSIEAFDRLADQGIIGVQTVRPDPEPPKEPPVLLAGQQAPPPAPTAEVILVQLVDKMNTLIGHVEKLLTRPATVLAAPAREGAKSKRIAPRIDPAQDEALRAIFQTNIELRRSIQKLDLLTASNAAHKPAASPSPMASTGHPGEPRLGTSATPRPREHVLKAQPAA